MRKLAFYLIYALAVLLFIELVLRFCYPLPEIKNFNRVNYQVLDVAAERGGFVRQTDMVWRSIPDTNYAFVSHLNNYGFRGEDWSVEKSDKKRVLILGDSFTEGMMCRDDQTLVAQFKREAEAKGLNLEVMNAGMMGIGINQYLQFIKDALPIFKPEELILVFYSNDMPFSQADKRPLQKFKPNYYSNWKPRLLVLLEAIEDKNPIPIRFSRQEIPYFKAVPDARNPWTFKEDELAPHVKRELAEAMKRGDLNYYRPNAYVREQGFLQRLVDIMPQLQFIRDYSLEQNCKLTMVYVPSRHQISDYYYPFEREYCQLECPEQYSLMGPEFQVHRDYLIQKTLQLGINYSDLSEEVKAEESKGNHLYWHYDDHMNAKGYKLLGKELFDFWYNSSQP